MPLECEELEGHGVPEKVSCIDGKIKDPLQFTVFSAFQGRRTMVNKIWRQEVVRKCLCRKNEPVHARVFSEPKCQQHVATWYLFYRWLIFAAWACIIVCSITEYGSYKALIAYDKWLIYLTNWDLILGLSQALLGCVLASRRWKLQKISHFDPSTLTLGSMEKAYWFLYVVTTNTAIAVTINYWCSVYNPEIHYLDPLNIMLHICNSILMIMDFCIANIPFRLENLWWCLIIMFLYIFFSVAYYLAGGLDKHGYHYIYKMLDWKKPAQTSLVCVGEVIFVSLLHSFMCLLERLKSHIYVKVNKKLEKSADNDIPAVHRQADVV